MADTITRSPPPVVRALVGTAGLTAALLAMDGLRMFANAPLTERWLQVETHLYYALLTLLLPCAFLVYPLTRAWWRWLVDVPLALAAAGAGGFLFVHAVAILDNGWEFGAPLYMVVVASLTWALVLEALRRAGGITLTLIAALFSLYPLIADHMPDPLSGLSASFGEVAAYHVLSTESLLGIPFRAFANLVIGFLVFGVALQHTGGGRFFIDLAFALLGAVRGGAAKVAILASGLMGSMSGSVITHVLTVMGSTAFVMAAILEMPYYQVALAATIPALLYFTGLFIQIDLHAAREGLEAEDADALPQLGATLAGGWHYLGVFALLVVLLVYLQREAQAPWMATGVLLVLNQLRSADRWDLRATGNFLYAGAALLVEIMVVLAGVGLIVGALSLTVVPGGRFDADAVDHRCRHQFPAGHRHDRHRCLHLSRGGAGAGAGGGWSAAAGRAPVHPVLGDVVVHHAAGGTGRIRRRQHRRGAAHANRLHRHAPGRRHLSDPVPVRVESRIPAGRAVVARRPGDRCVSGRYLAHRHGAAGLGATTGGGGYAGACGGWHRRYSDRHAVHAALTGCRKVLLAFAKHAQANARFRLGSQFIRLPVHEALPMIALDHLSIFVSDEQVSRDWYVDHFGFTVEFEVPERHTVALIDDNEFTLFLVRDAERAAHPSCIPALQVEDVHAHNISLRAAGADIVAEPGHRYWGFGLEVRDPDGYLLHVWDAETMAAAQ